MKQYAMSAWAPLEIGDVVMAVLQDGPQTCTVTDIVMVHSAARNEVSVYYELDHRASRVPIEKIMRRIVDGKPVPVGKELCGSDVIS